MYNLLISGGVAAAALAVGVWTVGEYAAGLVTGVFAFLVAMFVLWRRTNQRLEAVAQQAQSRMQAGDVDGARTALVEGLALGRWQLLVREQLHGQIGQLDAMQGVGLMMQGKSLEARARWESACDELAKAMTRDTASQTTRGVIQHRLGCTDEAIATLEAASSTAGEPFFWGVYAWILNEVQKREQALAVVGRGLAEHKGNAALTTVQEALSNKRRPDFGAAFGERWYQVFPDQMSQEQLRAMYEATTGKKVPPGAHVGPPGQAGRGARGPVRPPKTYPMPRR